MPELSTVVNALHDRLDQIRDTYDAFNRRVMVILAILTVVVIAFCGALVYLVQQNSARSSDIQQSRLNSIRVACQEQNARHDKTLQVLDAQIITVVLKRERPKMSKVNKARADVLIRTSNNISTFAQAEDLYKQSVKLLDPATAAQINQSKRSNTFLINALAPKENCNRRAHRLVRPLSPDL